MKAQKPELSLQKKLDHSDAKLIELILNGETQWYQNLVERYQKMVFSICIRIIKNPDAAQDICQEAFIIAYQTLDRLRDPNHFSYWISGITRNQCTRFIRREQKVNSISYDHLQEKGFEYIPEKEERPYQPEHVEKLQQLITELPEKEQMLLDLRYAQEYSCSKICELLNLTKSTVISRLFRIRQRLLKAMKREELS